MTELKPCPFCGSYDIDPNYSLDSDGVSTPGCMNCGAVGPCCVDDNRIKKDEQAVIAWNTRKEPKPNGKITQHWLSVAYERVMADDPEKDVMLDYGYIKEPKP